MLSTMRALFRPFALHAAYTPIETIVFFSIVGTLAYFNILSAIRNSAFLNIDPETVKPAYMIYKRLGEWVPVRESAWVHSNEPVLELQQLVFAIDPAQKPLSSLSMTSPPLSTATLNYTLHSCNSCFTSRESSLRTATHTLSFNSGTNLLHSHHFVHQPTGISFFVENKVHSAYALRAFITRFWDLAKKADSLDILLILAGYILMFITFYLLLIRSRSLGSSFFLPLAIMSSSILALLISLPIAMALRIPIDPVALSEALPFLVCTVGFDKPLRLARAVFLHPHLTVPPALVPNVSSDKSGYPILRRPSIPPPSLSIPSSLIHSLKPAPMIITESLSHVYAPIIRDYILEIAVLTVGAYSRVGGLREVCALAALILAVDCLLLCTYLAAILGVMVEVSSLSGRFRHSCISSIHIIVQLIFCPMDLTASTLRHARPARCHYCLF